MNNSYLSHSKQAIPMMAGLWAGTIVLHCLESRRTTNKNLIISSIWGFWVEQRVARELADTRLMIDRVCEWVLLIRGPCCCNPKMNSKTLILQATTGIYDKYLQHSQSTKLFRSLASPFKHTPIYEYSVGFYQHLFESHSPSITTRERMQVDFWNADSSIKRCYICRILLRDNILLVMKVFHSPTASIHLQSSIVSLQTPYYQSLVREIYVTSLESFDRATGVMLRILRIWTKGEVSSFPLSPKSGTLRQFEEKKHTSMNSSQQKPINKLGSTMSISIYLDLLNFNGCDRVRYTKSISSTLSHWSPFLFAQATQQSSILLQEHYSDPFYSGNHFPLMVWLVLSMYLLLSRNLRTGLWTLSFCVTCDSPSQNVITGIWLHLNVWPLKFYGISMSKTDRLKLWNTKTRGH